MKLISIAAAVSCVATAVGAVPVLNTARTVATLNRTQIQRISQDIQSNLSTAANLINQVSQQEPVVDPPFTEAAAYLRHLMGAIQNGLQGLANLKGS